MPEPGQDDFVPKPISKESVPVALARAERYRLLNDPANAESICRDILAVDPENIEAKRALILSLTELFDHGLHGILQEAQELAASMPDEYRRLYLNGLIFERQARVQKLRSLPGWGNIAHDMLLEAMALYEKATELRPSGDDSALMRWNACARMINSHRQIRPSPDEGSGAQSMLE